MRCSLFRDQDLAQEDLIRVTGIFGEFAPLGRPAHTLPTGFSKILPNIMLISNIRENGETIGALPDGEMMFHHDTIHRDEPHKATLLYSVEIPTYGGDTLFASGTAAYDALDAAMKKKLEGLQGGQLLRLQFGEAQRQAGRRRRQPGGASCGAHARRNQAQGALRQPADVGPHRGHAGSRERRASQFSIRPLRKAGIRLHPRLAQGRSHRLGQSLLQPRAHRFPRRPAPAVAAHHREGQRAGHIDWRPPNRLELGADRFAEAKETSR